MKVYCACRVNQNTGEIDHVALSDYPIADELVPDSAPPSGLLQSVPPTPPPKSRIARLELDGYDKVPPARQVLESLRVGGNSAADRMKPDAPIEVVSGPKNKIPANVQVVPK